MPPAYDEQGTGIATSNHVQIPAAAITMPAIMAGIVIGGGGGI